jgi:hypothetical protein
MQITSVDARLGFAVAIGGAHLFAKMSASLAILFNWPHVSANVANIDQKAMTANAANRTWLVYW